jgi:hypothetical protein
MPGVGVEGAAQRRDAGPSPLGAVEPRVEQLVVLGGGEPKSQSTGSPPRGSTANG